MGADNHYSGAWRETYGMPSISGGFTLCGFTVYGLICSSAHFILGHEASMDQPHPLHHELKECDVVLLTMIGLALVPPTFLALATQWL